MQRRLARPLRKDDTHKSRSVNNCLTITIKQHLGQDKGGRSKGGFLNNRLFSWIDYYQFTHTISFITNIYIYIYIYTYISVYENNRWFRKPPLLGPLLSLRQNELCEGPREGGRVLPAPPAQAAGAPGKTKVIIIIISSSSSILIVIVIIVIISSLIIYL